MSHPEEVDNQNVEVEKKDEGFQAKAEALAQYRKQMEELRAKRYGVSGKMSEP